MQPEKTPTSVVYLSEDIESLINEGFEALGITSAEEKRMFHDNAGLAFVKANLRAAVNRWDMVLSKYSRQYPSLPLTEVIERVSQMRKFAGIAQDANRASELLKAKF